MHALTLYLIMKLGFISAALFWGSLLYLGYLFSQYVPIWWDSPSDGDSGWSEFWRGKREKATAAAAMIIAMALPSTKEAAVMTVVPAVAQSSIWYRLLGGGMDRRAVETARRLIRDGGQ